MTSATRAPTFAPAVRSWRLNPYSAGPIRATVELAVSLILALEILAQLMGAIIGVDTGKR